MRDVIIVENLGKRYSRRNSHRPRTIHEALTCGLRGLRSKEQFWALRELSFRVRRGSMLGVIGRNGAGKSTLLRMLGAIEIPDEGSIKTSGRVGALLTLGAGFHPDLTGRENVIVSGVVHGLTRSEVQKRFDAIVEFSEIKNFIDDPVRIYSSGMQMRLRFAVAIHMEPEVLLIDEVLSVGDASFERKCRDRIDRFRAAGCTVVLISHGLDQVREMCDEAIWLDAGRLEGHGPPNLVIEQYLLETSPARHSDSVDDSCDANNAIV